MEITQIIAIPAPAQSQTKRNITRDGGLIASQQRRINGGSPDAISRFNREQLTITTAKTLTGQQPNQQRSKRYTKKIFGIKRPEPNLKPTEFRLESDI